jgi:hypothetical protein
MSGRLRRSVEQPLTLAVDFAQRPTLTEVRFWHKADMLNALTNVRFYGQSAR